MFCSCIFGFDSILSSIPASIFHCDASLLPITDEQEENLRGVYINTISHSLGSRNGKHAFG